jgi:hypothetical protein
VQIRHLRLRLHVGEHADRDAVHKEPEHNRRIPPKSALVNCSESSLSVLDNRGPMKSGPDETRI